MNSLELAKELDISHYSITKIINKYYESFKEFGDIKTCTKINRNGRPTNLKVLNENHKKLLITLLKNTDKNLKLKIELIKK